MTTSIEDMTTNVRTRLGEPRAQAPTDLQVLNQVCSHTRNVLRLRRATGNPWNFNDLILDVQPGTSTYTISASDFGQPLAVLTWAPQVTTWVPRMIRMFEPQNFYVDYNNFPNLAGWNNWPWDGSNCTADRCSFSWRANIAYVEILPVPQLPASYKVRYLQSANGVNTAALTSSPLNNEDSDIVELRSALSLLPLTEWAASEDEGVRMNAEKRKDLFVTLDRDATEATRLMDANLRQPSGPRIYDRWQGSIVG